MTEPELRGTLLAYARWAGISIQTACMRNRRGKIVMCDDYPYLVDFVRSNMAVKQMGAPRKPRSQKKIHVTLRVTLEQWEKIKHIIGD